MNDRPSRFGLNHAQVAGRLRQDFPGDDPSAKGDGAFVHGAARLSVEPDGWATLRGLAGVSSDHAPTVVVAVLARARV